MTTAAMTTAGYGYRLPALGSWTQLPLLAQALLALRCASPGSSGQICAALSAAASKRLAHEIPQTLLGIKAWRPHCHDLRISTAMVL